MKLAAVIVVSVIVVFPSCITRTEQPVQALRSPDITSLKTFGTIGKELTFLRTDQEAELFIYTGMGCLTHMWFGGNFREYEYTRIRIYVDGEEDASIDMEMFLGHGIGFGDKLAPWGNERIGKTGDPSGVYNTYRIPFGKSVRVTAQLAPGADENPEFWWILRGTENLPVEFAGVRLPANARLKLHKLENHVAQPLEEFSICDVAGAGMLYQVTMQAKGLRNWGSYKDFSYLEACVRAYINEQADPLILSSGLEDYFLGTYYFNRGIYTNRLAGLTHLDEEKSEFSAYRFHEEDPVFFQNGLRLTNRCGEEIGGKVYGDPLKTRYTTYVWVYEW